MSDENTKLTIKDQLDSFIKAYPKANTLSCTFRGSGDSFDEFDDICVLNNKGKPIDFGSEFDFDSIFCFLCSYAYFSRLSFFYQLLIN